MHELAIAQSVVRAVVSEMERTGAMSVRSIEVEVGALEGLQEEGVRRAFELESAGTRLEGTVLHVTIRPASATCGTCGFTQSFEPPRGAHGHALASPTCPRCGGAMQIRGGRGFVVRSAAMILGGP